MPEPAPAEDPRDRPRRVDARRNLEAIVEAAVPLLCEQPRASMQQIAEAAGVHRATVHRHFRSRDDLLDELRERAARLSGTELDAAFTGPADDPGQTLQRATAALLRVGTRYRLYRYTTWRSAANEDRALEISERIGALVAAAQVAGQVRADLPLPQLVAAFGGLITGMFPLVDTGVLTIEEAAQTVRTLLGPSGS